jgi:hypothetical protein
MELQIIGQNCITQLISCIKNLQISKEDQNKSSKWNHKLISAYSSLGFL